MNNHSFDDLIRQKASGHEAPVLPGTWEAIAQKKKKKRRYLLCWWITGIVLLSGSTAWVFYKEKSGHKDMTAAVKNEINQQYASKPGENEAGERNGVQKDKQNAIQQDKMQAVAVNKEEKRDIASTPALPAKQKISNDTFPLSSGGGRVASKRVPENSKTADAGDEDRINGSLTLNRKSIVSPVKEKGIHQVGRPVDQEESKKTVIGDLQGDIVFSDKQSLSRTGSLSPGLLYPEHIKVTESIIGDPSVRIAYSSLTDSMITAGIDSIKTPGIAIIAASEDQQATAGDRRSRRDAWTIDISVMPFLPVQQDESLLYLSRTTTGTMQQADYKTDKIFSHLQPAVAYTIAVHRKINSRLRIGAGLQYAMIKEKVDLTGKETKKNYTEVQRLENGSSGPQLIKDTVETISSGTLVIDALNSYRFISIPLSVQYRLMEKKQWSLHLNSGLFVNIATSYHNSMQGDWNRVDAQGIHTGGQNTAIGVDLFAGLKASRNCGAFRFFAEPVLRYNIRRYDLASMINRKFIHQAGLSVGVTYQLGN